MVTTAASSAKKPVTPHNPADENKIINDKILAIENLIAGVYEQKEAEKLIQELSEKYSFSSKVTNLDNARKIEVLEKITEVLKEHKTTKEQNENTIRQEREIIEKDKTKGTLAIQPVLKEMAKKMPYAPSGIIYEKEKFLPTFYDRSFTRREKLEAIKRRKKVYESAGLVDDEYRRLVYLAKKETVAKITYDTARLYSLISTGQDLSDEDKKKHDLRRDKPSDFRNEAVLKMGKLVHDGIEKLGRGIYSQTDPKKTSKYKNYIKERQELLSNLIKDVRGIKKEVLRDYLNTLQEQLRKGEISQAQFDALKNAIIAEQNQEDAQIKLIDKTINDLGKDWYNDVEDYTNVSDDMWKFRLLQLVLMVTPFAGLNFLGPLHSIISSVFGSGGLAEGFSSLLTLDELGFLGDFAELIKLDEGFELLFKIPIVESLTEAGSYITESSIGSNLIQNALLPMVAASITQFIAVGGYSVVRIKDEVLHKKKYDAKFDNHDKSLLSAMETLATKKAYNDKDFESVVNTKFNIFFDMYKNNSSCEIFEQLCNAGIIEQVMGKDFLKMMEEKNIIDGGALNMENLAKLINEEVATSERLREFQNRAFFFRGVCRDMNHYSSLPEALTEFESRYNSKENRDKIIGKELEYVKQDYIFSRANLYGIAFDENKLEGKFGDREKVFADRKSIAKKLEQEIKLKEVKDFKEKGSGNYNELSCINEATSPQKEPKIPMPNNKPSGPNATCISGSLQLAIPSKA